MPFRMRIRAAGKGDGASRSCIRPTGFKHSHYGEPPRPSPRSASCHRGWSRGFDGEPVLEGGGGGRPEPVPTVRVISVCVRQQKRSPPRAALSLGGSDGPGQGGGRLWRSRRRARASRGTTERGLAAGRQAARPAEDGDRPPLPEQPSGARVRACARASRCPCPLCSERRSWSFQGETRLRARTCLCVSCLNNGPCPGFTDGPKQAPGALPPNPRAGTRGHLSRPAEAPPGTGGPVHPSARPRPPPTPRSHSAVSSR